MTKPVYFQVPDSKIHVLVADEDDPSRFPLGRAKCAPFPRKRTDAIFEGADVRQQDLCVICIRGSLK